MHSNKVIKNYLYNTIYQVVILVTPLITTPYISRVLGAKGIGIYQYAYSFAAYFMLIGAFGTSLYGQREIAYIQDDNKKYTETFWEITAFRCFAAVLCAGVFYAVFCVNRENVVVYRILLVEILSAGIDISWFFMGLENFRQVVIRNIAVRIVGILLVFLFVKTSDDVARYAACLMLPTLLGNISLWFGLGKLLERSRRPFRELASGIRRRIRPILALFIPQIAIEVYTVLDKTMIGKLGTDIAQVGYYAQGQKIIKIVLMIITSLGTVMLPAMSALFSKGDREGIRNHIIKAFGFVSLISMALIFGLDAVAYRFVPVFFGDGFDPVAILMIIISPILFIIGVSNIIGKQYLLPTQQQTIFTASVVTGAAVNFLLNLLLIPRYDAVGASIATVIAEIAVTGVQCWHVRKELPLRKCFQPLWRYLLMGAVMFLAVRAVGGLFENNTLALIAMILTGATVYTTELLITRDPMLQMGIGLIKNKIQIGPIRKDRQRG